MDNQRGGKECPKQTLAKRFKSQEGKMKSGRAARSTTAARRDRKKFVKRVDTQCIYLFPM